MDASEKTKYRLANAVKELVVHKPIDKLTVKEICEACDMTRPTFYRNFLDKYDLVNWYFDKLAKESFKEMGDGKTILDALISKFNFIKKERHFFAAAFSSEGQNSLIEHDFSYIYQFYTDVIGKKTKKPLDENQKFILEMYCRGSIDMTVKWATTGMKLEPEELAKLLERSLPEELREYLLVLH